MPRSERHAQLRAELADVNNAIAKLRRHRSDIERELAKLRATPAPRRKAAR